MSPGTASPDRCGRILLRIARERIAQELGLGPANRWEEPWLLEPGATFVTLRLGAALRGCVGTVWAYRPLGEDVASNALAAAFEDPRFEPLTPEELTFTSLEVSLLSSPEPLPPTSEAGVAASLRPGVDGLYLDYRGKGGTLLPQVWEGLPDAAAFLQTLKLKAGLDPHFWSQEIRLWRYTVTKWREGDWVH